MNKIHLAIAALIATTPAVAQGPVAVPRFDSIELQGGGHVTIRHGATQRVTLVRGSQEVTRFGVQRGRLEIDACIRSCRNYDLRVEIVTPDVDALAIRGGGVIRVEGAFPRQSDLAVAVTGGGTIDARSIAATDVAASVSGGGLIRANARDTLAASINGGGAVRYVGDPEKTVAINGGGAVQRESGR
jgi:hypothetical protein